MPQPKSEVQAALEWLRAGGQVDETEVLPAGDPRVPPLDDQGVIPDWIQNILGIGSLASFVPPIAPIGGLAGLGLTGTSAIEAIAAAKKGKFKEAGIEGLFALLGTGGAIKGLRGLFEGAKSVPKETLEAITKHTARTSEIAKALQTATGKTRRALQLDLAKEQRAQIAEVRRLLREPRLQMRAATRAGKKPSKEVISASQEAAITAKGLGVGGAKKLAAQSPSKAALRARGPIITLLRKNNLPEELIAAVEESLKTSGKAVGRRAKMFDEMGSTATEILIRGGFIAGGAAAGGAAGRELAPEGSKTRGTVGGAVAGGLLGGNAAAIALAPKGARLEKVLDINFQNLLLGTRPLANANIGAYTGALTAMSQRLLEGRFRDAWNILKNLSPTNYVGHWTAAFRDPHIVQRLSAGKTRVPIRPGLGGVATRFIGAGDYAASRAMMSGGFTREEALNLTLSGDPRTQLGKLIQTALGTPVKDIVSSKTIKKMNRPGFQVLARGLVPFSRVLVQSMERGVEFSPLGALPGVARAMGNVPRTALAKAGIGTALAGGVGGLSAFTSPEVDPLVLPLAGPAMLPAAIMQHALRGSFRNVPIPSIINRSLGELPLVQEQTGLSTLVQRLLPPILREMAAGFDPAFAREPGPQAVVERLRAQGKLGPGRGEETAASLLAPLLMRVPGAREFLPETFAPTDVFGRPLFPERSGFTPRLDVRGERVLGPDDLVKPEGQTLPVGPLELTLPKFLLGAPQENPPVFPPFDPTAQTIAELERASAPQGNILNPPTVPPSATIRDMMALRGEVPPEMPRDIRALALRAKGAIVQNPVEALIQTPTFRQAPPEIQNILLRRAIQLAREQSERVGQAASSSVLQDPAQLAQTRALLQQLIAGIQQR